MKWTLAVILLLGILPSAKVLLAQDLLAEVSARRQIATQLAKTSVSEAIRASRRATDIRAREILAGARSDLRRETDLPDTTISELDRAITRELDVLGQAAGAAPILPLPKPGTGLPLAKERAQIDEEGLWNDRRRKAEADSKLVERREKAFEGQLDGVDKSAIAPKEDFSGPSAQRQKILANRVSMDGHPTAAEKTIIKKLSQPFGRDMDKVSLEDFFKYLSDKHGIEVLYSQSDLDSQSADILSAATPKISGKLTVRSAIRLVVAKYNLSYWIVDEGIEVVSQEKSRTTLLTRTYYVGDLAAVFAPPTWNYQIWRNAWGNPVVLYGPNPAGTPLGQQLIMRQNVESLMQMIMGIDTQGFGADGQARITYHPATMSLVIKATAENHQKIMGGSR